MPRKRITRVLFVFAILILFIPQQFSCESKSCRDLPESEDPARLAVNDRCVFGVDVDGEPLQQIESLYPVCDFYINTEPSVHVQTYFEGKILERKFNARIAARVCLVRMMDAAMEEREGWIREKSIPTLAEIYASKEENGLDADLPATLSAKPAGGYLFFFDVSFRNRTDTDRFLYFKPLDPGTPFAPPVEVRERRTADPVPLKIDLAAASLTERNVVSNRVLYKRLRPGDEWRLFLRVTLLDPGKEPAGYTAVLNYSVRKDPESGNYWACSSPLVLFE